MPDFTGIITVLRDQAKSIWQDDHYVATTSFVIGKEIAMFAQPMNQEAAMISPAVRAGLHAMMVVASDALVIGQIDESWCKEVSDEEDIINRKERLADRADTDPTIRTALTVLAMSVATGDCAVGISSLSVDDWGNPAWTDHIEEGPQGMIVEQTRTALFMGTQLNASPLATMEGLAEFFDECGWALVINQGPQEIA